MMKEYDGFIQIQAYVVHHTDLPSHIIKNAQKTDVLCTPSEKSVHSLQRSCDNFFFSLSYILLIHSYSQGWVVFFNSYNFGSMSLFMLIGANQASLFGITLMWPK